MKPEDFLKLILIIIFALPVVKKFIEIKEEENQSKNIQSNKSLPSRSYKNSNDRVLVLCIDAAKEDILRSLMEHGVTPDNCKGIYNATKYLWVGTEAKFSESPLKDCFFTFNEYSISDEKRSEYDVHLVQIQLIEDEPGFEANVNLLKRYDAFLALPKNSGELKVSPRLSCKAYDNALYSR